MAAIQPSPALIVPADTPIHECVRRMRDHSVGSLLIVGYASPYPLVGIFTERDLLMKFEDIQTGQHWTKEIAVVMHKPVVTVGLTELDQASEIMLKHGFRHLPVVYEDEKGDTHVAGMISMRDLFRSFASRDEAVGKLPKKRPKVGVLAGRDDRFRALCAIFETRERATVQRLSAGKVLEQIRGIEFVFIDLDDLPPKEWTRLLQDLNRTESPVKVFVLFSPASHTPATTQKLRELARSERFAPFAKPVNVLEMLAQLNRWRGRPIRKP